MYLDTLRTVIGRRRQPHTRARPGSATAPAPSPRTRILCLCAAGLAAAAAAEPLPHAAAGALAQETPSARVERLRKIPARALKGVMQPPDGRSVTIDRDRFTLAPGALIRDLDNRIVLPTHLREPAKVRYTLDRNRQISQIWIVAEEP